MTEPNQAPAGQQDALAAAERELQSARDALAAAEQKLAEAQAAAAQGANAQSAATAADQGYAVSQPGAGQQQAQQTYQSGYQQPHYVAPLSSRDHVAAGLLAIFLGGFGVHKFYLGYNTQGFILLALSLVGGLFSFGLVTGIVWIVGIVEGIIYLTKTQSEFEQIYVSNKREWF